MSAESMQWLNSNVLVGFTNERGHAWHYKASEQGSESNHYLGAIPVDDILRRLFYWEAVEGSVQVQVLSADGVLTINDESRKAIVRPDTGAVFGIFKEGYTMHQPQRWLLEEVATLLDDDLAIGSAGLLKGGAVAWVQVEVPETITTPEGVKFRPHLLAATSFDGSLSTTYKRSCTNTVCDNTMGMALAAEGETLKVRHSRYSALKLQDARDALALVHTMAEDFSAQVAELCSVTVSEGDWSKFLDSLVPMPEDEGRAKTIATNKRDSLVRLWKHDERVAPWAGTAYGVVQAVNTFVHHDGVQRGNRIERNAAMAMSGGFDKLDTSTLSTLQAVLA